MLRAIDRFFSDSEAWFVTVLERGQSNGSLSFEASPRDVAGTIIAGLVGAMLHARPNEDVRRFRSAASLLLATVVGSVAARPNRRSPRRGGRQDGVEFVELAADAAADLLAQLEDAFVGDRVAHVVAILGARHHAGGVEDAKVLGDVLLGGTEGALEFADGGLAATELVQELIRIGSASTRKRCAINSMSGSESGCVTVTVEATGRG